MRSVFNVRDRIRSGAFAPLILPIPPRPDVSAIDSKKEEKRIIKECEAARKAAYDHNNRVSQNSRHLLFEALAEENGVVGHPKLKMLEALVWERSHNGGQWAIVLTYEELVVLIQP